MIKRKINQLLGFLPLLFFLAVWQLSADQSPRTQFLFGSPILVIQKLAVNIANGELLVHAAITGIEALGGFLIGVTAGSVIGFSLLYFPKLASVSRPYVLALGSIPIFAFAPMMIVWFGVGIQMKIAMATFSTILVALSQAYDGGKKVDPELKTLFELNNSSNRQLFQKLILPSSIDWVLASLRLNIGLALLGAFIGGVYCIRKRARLHHAKGRRFIRYSLCACSGCMYYRIGIFIQSFRQQHCTQSAVVC